MRRFIVQWLVTALSLLAVTYIFEGIKIHSPGALLIAALLLGLMNAFVRPIILLVTLPINLLTLGLFTFVINGVLFLIVAWLVAGFEVSGFWTGVAGAFTISLISFGVNRLMADSR